ncbi:MAG: phospholipid carrier-dependent glycosyltransferase, partial [Caldilineaceae bacterium]
AEQVWYGNRPLFLPANGGREALYTYLQVAIGSLLGFTVYSLRLTSALAGIFTIPATYWLLRTMLKRRSRAVALFTSLALAISFWHLHFSHYGIRVILMPLLLCGLIGSFWLSLHSPRPRTRRRALVLAGILTGLAPWTHPAGRFVPFILLGYGGWLIWRGGRPVLRAALTTLLVVGAIAFLVFLPLGIEFYRHPDFFFGHASEVSIFAERVSGESQPWQLLGENMLRVLSMFNVRGDIEWAHNIPGRPVFEWPLGLAFVLGVGIWLVRLLRRRPDDPDVDALALLAGWTAVMLLPSVLSEAAPNYSRTLPAVPAVFVAVGLGLSWLVEMITDWVARRRNGADLYWVGYAVAGSLVAGSGLWASYDYFVRYPQMPESYYIYDADKLDALAALEALAAAGNTVYLAPLERARHLCLPAQHRDHQILGRRRDLGVAAARLRRRLCLPGRKAGAGRRYRARVGWHRRRNAFDDRYGKALLALVKVPAAQLTTWPERYEPTPPAADVATDLPAHFDDAPTLLGLQQRNDNRELRLFWQAEAPTYRNLTTFLHFLDRDGRRVAQVDKLPGDGTYLTPSWTPGERVIEQYHVDLQELCAANGDDLTLIVGWYEFAADGARRPAWMTPATRRATAPWPAPSPCQSRPIPRPISLPPASNVTVADDITLYGYTVNGDLFTPGAAFSIDLFWHVSAALNEELVTVQLRQGETALPLWEAVVAPDVPWHTGELVCRRAHVVLPATLPAGNYVLELQAADDAPVAFHTLTLTAQ